MAAFDLLGKLAACFRVLIPLSSFDCSIINNNIKLVMVDRCLQGMLPDILGNCGKFCCLSGFRAVKCSSGVKTWRY